MNDDKLFVVGPSKDLDLLSIKYLEGKRNKGYTILSYGDSIKRFLELDFYPDYWTFVDPNTVLHFQEKIISGRFNSVELIVPDLYSKNCRGFYNCGYTSNSLEKNKQLFLYLEQGFYDSFRIYNRLNFQTIKGVGYDVDYKENLYVHVKKDFKTFFNTCKFSYNLLPLIFFAFKSCKIFEFLAFGQYHLPRYFNNSSGDYLFYIKCYEQIKPKFIDYIKDNQLDLRFLGNESYFKELQVWHH